LQIPPGYCDPGELAFSCHLDSRPRARSKSLGPPIPASRRESTAVDFRPRVEDLAERLVRLRCPRHEAKRVVAGAMDTLAQEAIPEPTDEDILRRAFEMHARHRPGAPPIAIGGRPKSPFGIRPDKGFSTRKGLLDRPLQL